MNGLAVFLFSKVKMIRHFNDCKHLQLRYGMARSSSSQYFEIAMDSAFIFSPSPVIRSLLAWSITYAK